jgi:hypothetical protein
MTANGAPVCRIETWTWISEWILCRTLSADDVAIPSGGDGLSGVEGDGSAAVSCAAAAGAARTSPAATAASANLRLGGS